jgi:hypothetical protein
VAVSGTSPPRSSASTASSIVEPGNRDATNSNCSRTVRPGKMFVATYLGHVEVRDVYWYLSAVPELVSIVADRFEAFAEHAAEGVS